MSMLEDLKLKKDLIIANFKEAANDGYDHSIESAGKKGLRSGRVSELTAIADLKPGGQQVDGMLGFHI